jgi:CheY-like chemotaxis protein
MAPDTFPGASAAPACVLVATDDGVLGPLLITLLSDTGYPTLYLTNGQDALERLRSSDQPLVGLLSLRWRPWNSLAVLKAAAADPALATRHVYILLTALWDRLPGEYAALQSTLDVTVVPKPVGMDALLAAVARAAARLNDRAVQP